MFRADLPIKPDAKTINAVLMDGGVGDHVGGSLIAIDYILRRYSWISINLWLPDLISEISKNLLEHHGSRLYVGKYTEMQSKYDSNMTTITTKWDGRFSPMKVHTTDYSFSVLCDENPPIWEKNSLRLNPKPVSINKFKLPNKYIVLLTGFTAAVREFQPETVNTLAKYVKQKGYTPIFLGQKAAQTGTRHVIEATFNQEIDFKAGISLLDKTSLPQAAKIMANAAVVIGVDCGLMHVAACTDAMIVGGYTTVSPELRAPIRNNMIGWNWQSVTPDEDLGCKFCQVKTNFIYDHDYKDCLYQSKPEYAFACVKQLTTEKFIEKLDKIL